VFIGISAGPAAHTSLVTLIQNRAPERAGFALALFDRLNVWRKDRVVTRPEDVVHSGSGRPKPFDCDSEAAPFARPGNMT
jgi:hypothetical protein